MITIEQIEKEELAVDGLRILHSKLDRIERALARDDEELAEVTRARLVALGYEVSDMPHGEGFIEVEGPGLWWARKPEVAPPEEVKGLSWAEVRKMAMRWPEKRFGASRPHWSAGEYIMMQRDFRSLPVNTHVGCDDYDANDWVVRRVE